MHKMNHKWYLLKSCGLYFEKLTKTVRKNTKSSMDQKVLSNFSKTLPKNVQKI